MSFYSKIVDHLNAAARTKDAAKVALAARRSEGQTLVIPGSSRRRHRRSPLE